MTAVAEAIPGPRPQRFTRLTMDHCTTQHTQMSAHLERLTKRSEQCQVGADGAEETGVYVGT